MKCDQCKAYFERGDEKNTWGRCCVRIVTWRYYIPAKPCDPWAVYAAKSMTNENTQLTKRQENILAVLKETNGIELESLAKRLGLNTGDLERELATLRHMEKIRAAKEGNMKIFTVVMDLEM